MKKNRLLKRHQTDLDVNINEFKRALSWLDYNCLYSRLLTCNENRVKSATQCHERKLHSLGIPVKRSLCTNKVVINLSKRPLTAAEKDVLSYGLSFSLPKFSIDFVQHFFDFEKLIQILRHINIRHSLGKSWDNLVEGISAIAYMSYHQFNEFKQSFPKLPQTQYEALKTLKSDKTIVITRPDKGKGTVILDRTEYVQKVEAILKDKSKFRLITESAFSFITRVEDKLNRLLRELLKLEIINKNTFAYLSPSGTSPGVLYGLPKTHKINVPIRPILSTIGTFNYNLAKYLVPIIEPLTTNEYTLKNSFEFVKDIKSINNNNNVVMASFDIQSLFTNIPLTETIEIITNHFFENQTKFLGYTKSLFTRLLMLAIKDSPFLFNDKLYTQTDGVSMGSCLGPSLANAFLCHHEQIWLSECPTSFKPVYYKRYVDDTFLLFKDINHISEFLEYLNSKHPNIKFTCEVENNDTLPFLDVLVSRKSGSFTTSVYRKPTFTGLGMQYLSFIPEGFKRNSIKTLLYRCYEVCSNWISFHKEIEFLSNFFQNNGFPLGIIEETVRNFLDTRMGTKPTGDVPKVDTHYIKLPYYGHLSFVIRKQLHSLLKQFYPDVKFVMIFSNKFTIGSMFKYKDNLPTTLISNVIYEFKCSSCNARYIGETVRNLALRFSEHKGVSARTGRPLASPSFSAIRSHSLQSDHPFSINDFTILKRASQPTDTKLLEALYIKHLSPSLNNQITSVSLNIVKGNQSAG